MSIYHVAPMGHAGDLLSMAAQIGEVDALAEWSERWPDAGDIAQYHIHQVHCHATLDEARDYAAAFGGVIFAVDDEYLNVRIDTLEYPHPVVNGRIPADCITRLDA